MDRLSFRCAIARDAPSLAQFAARTFADTFAADNHPEHMQAYLESAFGEAQQRAEIETVDALTLLAERAGRLVGFAQLQRADPPPPIKAAGGLEINRFYVDHAEHGSGLAQQLMAEVRARARQQGARTLWLGVWERNARAISFYRRQGFVDVGATFFMLGPDRQNDRVMLAEVNGLPGL